MTSSDNLGIFSFSNDNKSVTPKLSSMQPRPSINSENLSNKSLPALLLRSSTMNDLKSVSQRRNNYPSDNQGINNLLTSEFPINTNIAYTEGNI